MEWVEERNNQFMARGYTMDGREVTYSAPWKGSTRSGTQCNNKAITSLRGVVAPLKAAALQTAEERPSR